MLKIRTEERMAEAFAGSLTIGVNTGMKVFAKSSLLEPNAFSHQTIREKSGLIAGRNRLQNTRKEK
jgi:hypothetical protein